MNWIAQQIVSRVLLFGNERGHVGYCFPIEGLPPPEIDDWPLVREAERHGLIRFSFAEPKASRPDGGPLSTRNFYTITDSGRALLSKLEGK